MAKTDIPSWMHGDEILDLNKALVKIEEPAPISQTPVIDSGTVFLIWREKNIPDDPILEQGKFPTTSAYHIATFKDYASQDEMEQIVGEYADLRAEYDKIEDKRGGYAILIGKAVQSVEKKTVQTIKTVVQF